jgi:Cu-processing system ATP-binding protein
MASAWCGAGVSGGAAHDRLPARDLALYDNLTGLETLQFFSRLKGAPPEKCRPVLERSACRMRGRRRVREYSKGMRQRLGFAQALLGSPKLLFLDEPTNGLDPDASRGFYAILRELRAPASPSFSVRTSSRKSRSGWTAWRSWPTGVFGRWVRCRNCAKQLDLPVRFTIRVVPGASADVCAVRWGSLPCERNWKAGR